MFSPEHHRMLSYAPKSSSGDHRRWKPSLEIAPNCPRCDSSNTKFCYYNNYSLTQPRYFCKGCRRYWTKGGSLRNVPVGGGCRKNRRGKSSRLPAADSTIASSSSSISNPHDNNTKVRPDRALDDMFDNYHPNSNSGGNGNGNGNNIDMAVMYARYLNQTPDKLPLEIGELSSSSTTLSNEMNCNMGFMGSNYGMDETAVELGFAAEPAVRLPEANGDLFPTNWGSAYPNMNWQGQEMNVGVMSTRNLQEIGYNHHFAELMIGDWSTMEQSGFEAF